MVTKGDLPLNIRWTLNDQPIITNENGFTIGKMSQRLSTLSIESIQGLHRGIFKCIAENKAGSMEYSTVLQVNGKIGKIKFVMFFCINFNYKKITSK